MSRKVIVTPTAEADLDAILRYIALDDAVAGRRFIAALRAHIETLRDMPERCPRAPEDGLDGIEIRQLIHGRYHILFTTDADRVVVLQVRHGARASPGRG